MKLNLHSFDLVPFQLTIHIEELLETAYNKYSAWQAKKMKMAQGRR